MEFNIKGMSANLGIPFETALSEYLTQKTLITTWIIKRLFHSPTLSLLNIFYAQLQKHLTLNTLPKIKNETKYI